MSINPPTDLIADVINAADPARAARTEAWLRSIGQASSGGSFASIVERKAASATNVSQALETAVRGPARSAVASNDPIEKRKQALVEFEGTVLGILVNELIPKSQSSVLGSGADGDIWRSMLSNEIGRQLAKSGVLHIHDRLFRSHPFDASRTDKASDTSQMSAKALSEPIRNGSRGVSGVRARYGGV